ncbi:hypothetical protein K469DRAFT_365816 [Zopfia rhizophila CBS 207.26]|uniref:Uncharacterized protein n=1 Tax=Zopfia rhizophila CBS 207.26 TaxID=1314779 RepID=A0A6A6EJP4_9PEZI|nr:hypothetical protein K469DRAFT_365816 [Zopfia rhizophila CBS 207.26]
MAGALSLSSLQSLAHSGSALLSALRKALLSKFETLATNQSIPLREIPLGLHWIALASMNEEQRSAIRTKCPDLQEFEVSQDKNLIEATCREWQYSERFLAPHAIIESAHFSHGSKLALPATLGGSLLISSWKVSDTHRAAFYGDYATLASEISKGEVNNSNNKVLWTPLHSPGFSSRHKSVQMLLEAGANVNAALGRNSRFTCTPLLLAVLLSDTSMVKVLLERHDIDFWTRENGW